MERPYDPCRGPSWPIWTRRRVRRPRYALRFTTRTRGPSPAMRAALAAFEDHARRWVAARVEVLAEGRLPVTPARDTRLDLSAGRRPACLSGGSL
ncbi:hypothetical protein [Methylobacterium sp. SD21]|uniref:hypothetical protein n=1 Tax=Methylobacterium litchii TaxID=3138810 RepID=UPI00313CD704